MTVNYENGKIYQLVNFVNDYVYVGSTCGSISKRLHNHKRKYLSGQAATRKLYQMVDEIGWDNFRMILVENYPCSCRADLLKREHHHIQQVPKDRLLNMIGAYTTKEEKIRRLHDAVDDGVAVVHRRVAAVGQVQAGGDVGQSALRRDHEVDGGVAQVDVGQAGTACGRVHREA